MSTKWKATEVRELLTLQAKEEINCHMKEMLKDCFFYIIALLLFRKCYPTHMLYLMLDAEAVVWAAHRASLQYASPASCLKWHTGAGLCQHCSVKICSDRKWWTQWTPQDYIQSQYKDTIRCDVTSDDTNLATYTMQITRCGVHHLHCLHHLITQS